MTARTTFEVFTLFPEAVASFTRAGLLGKAIERGIVDVHCTNYRDFATDTHRTVDDTPFGGGAGVVIKPEPVVHALEAVQAERGPMHRILLTPSAPRFDQRVAERLAGLPRVALVCGRYEGIDDRIREHFVDECLSLGDFVLGGGEVAALAIIEAVSRLLEGAIGNPESAVGESFRADVGGAWLEHPQYTRPAQFRGHAVPEVLLGGNHAAIAKWRQDSARRRTWALRPDLRSAPALPPDTQIHLAVPVDAAPTEAWVEVARRHAVAGLIVVGAGPEAVLAWVQALGGRVQVTGFADLQAVRKRLRQRDGVAPWVVAAVEDAPENTALIRTGAELTDTLQTARAPGSGPATPATVVIWLPLAPDPASMGPVDAVFAPNNVPLATASTIADASRPHQRLAALADRALTSLLRVTP